jgi:quercetin dioxygenase-like cupin family protein
MSSLHRSISTESPGTLHVRLADTAAAVEEGARLAASGRQSQTIVKQGALRMALMALAPDAYIPPHRTAATVSVHVLRGDAQLQVEGQEYEVNSPELLVLAAGVEHAVRSREGALILLTVVEDAASAASASQAAPPTTTPPTPRP